MHRYGVLFIIFLILPSAFMAEELFIRLNQVGFLPGDIKSGIILTEDPLRELTFQIISSKTDKLIEEGSIQSTGMRYGDDFYSYIFDFSSFRRLGDFYIKVGNRESDDFTIGYTVYNNIAEELLGFFAIQRCGPTDPAGHGKCHIADATYLIDGKDTIRTQIDVTGGWHDAADYVKFFNTTAYATYTLLFSYEFSPGKFSFDNNGNGAPDILEEAKIGLDWLLRAHYKNDKFITQVQDLRDHSVGWRMPEDDPLGFDRPGFTGMGKNLAGLYSATMALGSRIWKERFGNETFSAQLLREAENVFDLMDFIPDVDSSGTGEYVDTKFEGKVALGAIELFITTEDQKYLTEAKIHANRAGSDHWWSWGNINSYAHYRLAKYDWKYTDYLRANLEGFNQNKNTKVFGTGASFFWGSNNTLLGITLQNILWNDLTSDETYDSVATYQRDYMLGRNPWGLSFIYGVGKKFTRNFHHQIAWFDDGKLHGGFAAGPVSREALDSYEIEFEKRDYYSRFQTDSAVYRDDRQDYVTNEPTITANATAIFVFGALSSARNGK